MISLIPLYFIYILNALKYRLKYPQAIVSPKSLLSQVKLGKKSAIQGGVMMRNCDVNDYTYIAGTEGGGICSHIWNAKIGKYCSLAHNLEFLHSNHDLSHITTYPFLSSENSFLYSIDQKSLMREQEIIIGNDVWIGANVTIIGKVHVGDGAVIGAGSLVTRDIPAYGIAVGVPAKVVKYRFHHAEIKKLEKIQWWDWTEEKIKTNQDLLLSNNISAFIKKYEK